jgi:hypothetical protein
VVKHWTYSRLFWVSDASLMRIDVIRIRRALRCLIKPTLFELWDGQGVFGL